MVSPLVSVIMSVHNGAHRVEQSVESILNQTVSDLEIIVCDDCSQDDTFSVLSAIAERDNRVLVFRNEKNLGLAASLNRCLERARGEYVARMDDDDWSFPSRLEIQIDFLRSHREFGFVGSNALRFDGESDIGVIERPETPSADSFLKGTPYIHPSVVFRKCVLDAVDGYSRASYASRRAQDYDLFMRLVAEGVKGYNIQDPLLRYKLTEDDIHKKLSFQRVLDEMSIRFHGFRRIGFPLKKYVYVFVPAYVFVKQSFVHR